MKTLNKFFFMLLMVLTIFGINKNLKAQPCVLYELFYCTDCDFNVEWRYDCGGGNFHSHIVNLPASTNGFFEMAAINCPPGNCSSIILTDVFIDGNHLDVQNTTLPFTECPVPVCGDVVEIIWESTRATVTAIDPVIGQCGDNCTHINSP